MRFLEASNELFYLAVTNGKLEFIKDVKGKVPVLPDFSLFYSICQDVKAKDLELDLPDSLINGENKR